jgi:hypothetical protein
LLLLLQSLGCLGATGDGVDLVLQRVGLLLDR